MKVCTCCWFQDLKAVARQFQYAIPGPNRSVRWDVERPMWECWMWAWADAMGTEEFGQMFYRGCKCGLVARGKDAKWRKKC